MLNVFNLGIVNYHVLSSLVTGVPIETPRWLVRLGLLLFVVGLFVLTTSRQFTPAAKQKQKKYQVLVLSVLYSCIFMFFIQHYYLIFFTRFADPDDINQYTEIKSNQYSQGDLICAANYPAEKKIKTCETEIKLACTSQGITVDLEMQATATCDLASQTFTLYSDFTVTSVLVDGREADFERSKDCLLVHIPAGKKINEPVTFSFSYHGYSLPIFPANESKVQLDRAFPWLPWPGSKKTSSYGSFYLYQATELFFIEDWQREDEVAYTLYYQGPGHLYTNLTSLGKNYYAGTSQNGVSLYSEMVRYDYADLAVYVPASLHQSADLLAAALDDLYDPLQDICTRLGSSHQLARPRSAAIIQMNYPLLNLFVAPQELYTWSDQWEIRQANAVSSLVQAKKRYTDAPAEYEAELIKTAVSYLLSPSAGYPLHVSQQSSSNYAAWASIYFTIDYLNEDQIDQYKFFLEEMFTGQGSEFINGELVQETPLSKLEKSWQTSILERMQAGENFDPVFHKLYQELLHQKNLTAADILAELYNFQGA